MRRGTREANHSAHIINGSARHRSAHVSRVPPSRIILISPSEWEPCNSHAYEYCSNGGHDNSWSVWNIGNEIREDGPARSRDRCVTSFAVLSRCPLVAMLPIVDLLSWTTCSLHGRMNVN